jgi:hypothetical protein
MKNYASLLLSALTLAGCSHWSSLDSTYVHDQRNIEVTFPKGWRRDATVSDATLATKDGVTLQWIRISRFKVDDDLPYTKRKLANTMLPQEVSEVAMDNLRSREGCTGFRVLENAPDSLCGLAGFRALAEWKSIDGLRMRDLVYGVMYDERYYEILYEAPLRYYFGRDSAEAVQVKSHFRLRDHRGHAGN